MVGVFDFTIDIAGTSEPDLKGAFTVRVDADGETTAHGILLVRGLEDGRSPTVFSTTEDGASSATCGDTNDNGIPGLTSVTVGLVRTGDGEPAQVAIRPAVEIDEARRSVYPATLVLEQGGRIIAEYQVTLQVSFRVL